ncbi:hypothetical protein EBESD8_24520 [Rhodococcus aetherivorans]|nr:hypothetical protein EBESD8_24520 [Rhodococcus aetherivorans]
MRGPGRESSGDEGRDERGGDRPEDPPPPTGTRRRLLGAHGSTSAKHCSHRHRSLSALLGRRRATGPRVSKTVSTRERAPGGGAAL